MAKSAECVPTWDDAVVALSRLQTTDASQHTPLTFALWLAAHKPAASDLIATARAEGFDDAVRVLRESELAGYQLVEPQRTANWLAAHKAEQPTRNNQDG